MSAKQPKITVRLYENEKVVQSTVLPSKTRILNWIRSKNKQTWGSGYLRVTYNNKKEFYNHAYFNNVAEADRLLSEFMDQYLTKTFA